ncbi:sigma-70 family RNA polymerase sigma factor [Microbacterium sp. SSW1-49]|uniref:Sigma-70 family RNA polymerase sigma factor n=1 Tax=Microbacterium croceum TaxID=2851645 RepID=A0ABT0FG15_9MICO|nr:sigma-70 family RNA polymerase sigma factor [Microbacterium croceum]MCK2037012.1 sigma-70 family RNA polymerase sigma factor [Microbacterium croceum]
MNGRSDAGRSPREAVFKEIYDTLWAPLQRHVECVVDDDSAVAEIVSDVFLLAWRKLDTAKPLGLIWLIRAADNKIKDRERRSRARARAMDTVHTVYAAPSDDDMLDTLAVRHAVEVALTQRERRIVKLAYWDQLSAGEIAELLRCSQASVWKTLSRARKKLEVELGLGTGEAAAEARRAVEAARPAPRTTG